MLERLPLSTHGLPPDQVARFSSGLPSTPLFPIGPGNQVRGQSNANRDSMRFRLHSLHQGSHSQASNKDSLRFRLHSLHQGSHSQASNKDSLRFKLHSLHQGSHR